MIAGGAGMDFKVLAVGDVVGNPGMEQIRRGLRRLKRETGADFVVVNGENASVVGMTPRQGEDILDAGADVITMGNHTFGKREIVDYMEDCSRILRPLNYAPQTPGRGWGILESRFGPVAVIDLIGRCNMDYSGQPFSAGGKSAEGSGYQIGFGGNACGSHFRKTGDGLYAGWTNQRPVGDPHPCAYRRRTGVAQWNRICDRSGYDRPPIFGVGYSAEALHCQVPGRPYSPLPVGRGTGEDRGCSVYPGQPNRFVPESGKGGSLR